METDLVAQVAHILQGEAGWWTGMLAVGYVMANRRMSPAFPDDVLGMLDEFNGYHDEPTTQAHFVAWYVVNDPGMLGELCKAAGIDLPGEPLFYAMGQAVDVEKRGWREGEVVIHDKDVPGEAVHLYAEWPTKRSGKSANYSGRIPEGT